MTDGFFIGLDRLQGLPQQRGEGGIKGGLK
jgi:hypothetical protein